MKNTLNDMDTIKNKNTCTISVSVQCRTRTSIAIKYFIFQRYDIKTRPRLRTIKTRFLKKLYTFFCFRQKSHVVPDFSQLSFK